MGNESERFSRRFVRSSEPEITVRDDAPQDLRQAILKIAEGELEIEPDYLLDVLCTVLRKVPETPDWNGEPTSWEQCQYLIEDCPWYNVYDFVEALYHKLKNSGEWKRALRWQNFINYHFIELGVGWRLVDGRLESRGPEASTILGAAARDALGAKDLPVARKEIHEALEALSRWPVPDLVGAVRHAAGALECTLKVVTGIENKTLGQMLKQRDDLMPPTIREAVEKLWGYASEEARHAREGKIPDPLEAELFVGISAVLCTYLVNKTGKNDARPTTL